MSTEIQEPPQAPESGVNVQQVHSQVVWREWIMVSIGLTALLAVLAVVLSVVALSSKSTTTTIAAAPTATAPAAAPAAQWIKASIKSDVQHGQKGPDGQWHDSYIPANLTVRAGSTVTMTVLNYDTSPHSFTSPTLKVAQTIAAGTAQGPAKTTFQFTAPAVAGKYLWICAIPCDPWAMATIGYMRGYVTVTT